MKRFDFIIVGQGLAGTTLAYQLIKERKKVLVIDEKKAFSASRVAAGLYNPVTGKRMLMTWKVKELFAYLETFYRDLEKLLNIEVLTPMSIYKPFSNKEEQAQWLTSEAAKEKEFVEIVQDEVKFKDIIHYDSGGFYTKRSGYLNLPLLLDSFRNYLQGQSALLNETFDFGQLKIGDDGITYQNLFEAEKIIFCEGKESRSNPYFSWLPVSPSKGEILKIKVDGLRMENILNKGVFLLPEKDNVFKVGSTYEWRFETEGITEKGREEICSKLECYFKLPYTVIDQTSGVRPASRDRRPFLGLHPEFKTLAVFNGLGTKGVSLAPYFSDQMKDLLLYSREPDMEVNIKRVYSLYFTHK